MQDMEAGACRLSTAIRNHERVVIYGDYDVDGTTGVSILYLFLKQFGLEANTTSHTALRRGKGLIPMESDKVFRKMVPSTFPWIGELPPLMKQNLQSRHEF